MSIQVLLADDHQMMRHGLKTVLEREHLKVVAETSDGREAVELSRKCRPDVAVLDDALPIVSGLDAAREILRRSRQTRIVILTTRTENSRVLEALSCGISGYVLKTQPAEDLVRAIGDVMAGLVYLSPAVSRAVVDAQRFGAGAKNDPLTLRERQTLRLVAEGKSTKEIAVLLGMSPKTVETHRRQLRSKLKVHETASLVRYAIRRGLVQP